MENQPHPETCSFVARPADSMDTGASVEGRQQEKNGAVSCSAPTPASEDQPQQGHGQHHSPSAERVLSIDALRGFDMFWIIGGAQVVKTWAAWLDRPWSGDMARQ